MTFQVKDFRSIVLAMINHTKATQDKLTDFHVGSVIRTLFEAPAVEIDEFYQQVFRGLLDAIPVSVYKAFGHDLLPPAYASGFVRFSTAVKSGKTITIPAGYEIYREDSDVKYTTRDAVALLAGTSYIDAPVIALTIGTAGNADIGVLSTMSSAIDGITRISNPKPITGGRDHETENERKNRFLEFISSLSRGTVPSIIYAAKLATVTNAEGEIIEYVTRVGIDEGPGYMDVYIYGSGGTPSNDLIRKAQFIIDGGYDESTGELASGYRGGGVSVLVSPIIEQSVDFGIKLKMLNDQYKTDEIREEIETALHNTLLSVKTGENISIAELRAVVLSISGVSKVIFDMETNVECAANHVLNIGKLNVEWL